MKTKEQTKDVAYVAKTTILQGERKLALSGLLKAITAGERKEIRFEQGELEVLRDLREVVEAMRPKNKEEK